MRFEFATAIRIIFGNGTIKEVAPIAAKMGKRIFVVTGSNINRATPLLNQLQKEKIMFEVFSVAGEPTTDVALDGIQQAKKTGCDLVIGFGGGSVIDAGKVIAALLANDGELMDYLEVIGRGKQITHPAAPFIAIPTTAGTGTEVTKNSVLTSVQHKVKVSIRSPLMHPRLAIVDPELTYSMPSEVTASTGLDALTQLLEPFVSNQSNPLTDGICREGLIKVARSLQTAYENGTNKSAREDMSLASLFGGFALANAKLGAVHGFAGPLGGLFKAPHGVICARLLPFVIETNLNCLIAREPNNSIIKRLDEVAQILTGNKNVKAQDGVEWIQELCDILDVPSLSKYSLTEKDFPIVVKKSKDSSSMKGNPIKLTEEEMTDILRKAL